MTKTASLALHPSRSFIDRVLSFLDHSAELAARNGDVAYFGLLRQVLRPSHLLERKPQPFLAQPQK